MARNFLEIKIQGLREVERALRDLPGDAQDELDEAKREVAEGLADRVRAAGMADTRQSARAATTVRADVSGDRPTVVAGPHPMLFGSEFGILRRTGWYARRRYLGSPERQYRAHRGSASYWFFKAQEANQGWVDQQWAQAEADIIGRWRA